MKLKQLLKTLNFFPEEETLKRLKKDSSNFKKLLEVEMKSKKIKGEIFIGGSFAKSTLVKKEIYDIDFFVRFEKTKENISELLEKIIKDISNKNNFQYNKIHGSRDYFRISYSKNYFFEIVPVLKIKRQKEAENVTDLSYFHVKYLKKKLSSKNLINEILIAKQFCMAQGIYGAESYINGFSGYGLECLIIYYRTFEKMAKELSKSKEKIVIDIEKKYKNKNEILICLNQSKLQGPIVLIDPTYKERNVLAALSNESFQKFQESLKNLIKIPNESFFRDKKIKESEVSSLAKKLSGEFLNITIYTDKQKGDIAGTKLRKFSKFLASEISKRFTILKEYFIYNEEQKADVYFIIKPKKEIIRQGPKVSMKKHVSAFKKKNKKTFIKNNIIYAKIENNIPGKEYLSNFHKSREQLLREMGISNMFLF